MIRNFQPGPLLEVLTIALSFWDAVNDTYISSVQAAAINKEFSVPQRMRFIKDWQLISLKSSCQKTKKCTTGVDPCHLRVKE